MSRCEKCKIEVLDHTQRCPFCHCVIPHSEEMAENVKHMYPDASVMVRKGRSLENLVLFLSICVISGLALLSYLVEPFWSAWLVITLILSYGNVVLRLAIMGRSSYQLKTMTLCLLAILMLFGIDYLTGQHGWSEDFCFPALILLLDLGILILMVVNRRNWQSYMMFQILMILCSVISVVLVFMNVIQYEVMSWLAFLISTLCFLGTLILGDRRAKEEMKRRFHI